ncbi:MAG: hypothetical protein JWO65_2493 [Sphingomonas bacterium]|nr:hypothetical protein [Sphingomonas bacterium]
MSDDREQRIRQRAYALWEQAGGAHGAHDDHWAQATREIDDKPTAAPKLRAAPAKPKSKPVAAKAAPPKASPKAKPAGRAKRKNG